jgi:hypothetical protein
MNSAPDLAAILRSCPDYWPIGQQYDTPNLKIFSPSQLVGVLVILQSRGWCDEQLQGFLCGDFIRVIEEIWH